MADRDADLAHLAAGERMVRVVAGLGGQVEGDRQAGLALGQVGPVERVAGRGAGVAGVRAQDPRPVRLPAARLGVTRRRRRPAYRRTVPAGNPPRAGPQAVERRRGRGRPVGRHVEVEDAVQASGAQQPGGAGGDAGEHEATTLAAGAAVGLEQDAEPGRVTDLDVAQVEEQVADAVVDRGVGERGADPPPSGRRCVPRSRPPGRGRSRRREPGGVAVGCSAIWSPLWAPRPVWASFTHVRTPRAHESGGNDPDYFAGVRSSTSDTCARWSGGSCTNDATASHRGQTP